MIGPASTFGSILKKLAAPGVSVKISQGTGDRPRPLGSIVGWKPTPPLMAISATSLETSWDRPTKKLISGLIFERKTVLSLNIDSKFLSNCIYSQVYLASKIIYNQAEYGFAPKGLLYVGGDGENFFGKSIGAELPGKFRHFQNENLEFHNNF